MTSVLWPELKGSRLKHARGNLAITADQKEVQNERTRAVAEPGNREMLVETTWPNAVRPALLTGPEEG